MSFTVKPIQPSCNSRPSNDSTPIKGIKLLSSLYNLCRMQRTSSDEMLMCCVDSRHGRVVFARKTSDVSMTMSVAIASVSQTTYEASLIPPSIAKPFVPSNWSYTIFSPYAINLQISRTR